MNITNFLKESQEYSTELDIISALYNQWNIQKLKKSGTCKAFLLNWKPVYFISNCNLVSNVIIKDDKEYQLKLHNCKIEDINYASKVALSFRECEELKLRICLIKFIF